MASYAIITSAGLSEAAQASNAGHFIKINHFIPVYDYRIDDNILPDPADSFGWDSNEISSVEGYDAVIPYGERLWRGDVGEYSLSDSEEYWVVSAAGAGAVGPTTITMANPLHNTSMPVNLRNGVPMWNWVSAAAADVPGQSSSSWVMYNAYTISNNNSTYNPETTTDLTKYFQDVTYGAHLGEDGKSRGSWQCRIKENVGQFKFNKIALYATKVDENGQAVNVGQAPVLFAIVIFPTQVKTNFKQGGVDDVVIDFQLDVSPTAVNFNNLLYGTSADYWMPVEVDGTPAHGLSHTGQVFISHNYTSEDFDSGKMVVSTWWSTNGSTSAYERNLPQLAIQFIDNSTGTSIRKRATFKINQSGNLVIDAVTSGGGVVELVSNGDEESLKLDGGNIKLGGVDGIRQLNTIAAGYRISEPNASSSTIAHGVFEGGDLVRKNQPQIIRVANTGTNSTSANSDMFYIAGLVDSTSSDNHSEILEILREFVSVNGKISNITDNEFLDSIISIIAPGGCNIMSRKNINILTQEDGVVNVRGDVLPTAKSTFNLGEDDKTWKSIHAEEIHGDEENNSQLNTSLIPSEDNDVCIGTEDKKLSDLQTTKINGYKIGYIDNAISNPATFHTDVISWKNLAQNFCLFLHYVINGNMCEIFLTIKGMKLTFKQNLAAALVVNFPLDSTVEEQFYLYKWLGERNPQFNIEFANRPTNTAIEGPYWINETVHMVILKPSLSNPNHPLTEVFHNVIAGSSDWDSRADDGNDSTYGWHLPSIDVGVPLKMRVKFTTENYVTTISSELATWIENIKSGGTDSSFNVAIGSAPLVELKRIIEMNDPNSELVKSFVSHWGAGVKFYTSIESFLQANYSFHYSTSNSSMYKTQEQVRFSVAYNQYLFDCVSTGEEGEGLDNNIGIFNLTFKDIIGTESSSPQNSLILHGNNVYLAPNLTSEYATAAQTIGTYKHDKVGSDDWIYVKQIPLKMYNVDSNAKQVMNIGRFGISYYNERSIDTISEKNQLMSRTEWYKSTLLKDSKDKGWQLTNYAW